MDKERFYQLIREYINKNIPFFFLIDFEKNNPIIIPINECEHAGVFFQLEQPDVSTSHPIMLKSVPVDFNIYQKAFNIIRNGIGRGDSFLTNLTMPTPIECDADLETIYQSSNASYKLYVKDKFVCFSPEQFIQIKNGKISTFPMKGTIMANTPNAEMTLLNNKKEAQEHNTIVDLMRNDLSMIADNVEVKRFRYISEIMTLKGRMLQTSSEITGCLNKNWQNDFGELLLKLLPAGSISGAPKQQTLNLIKKAEIDSRGYYTGIFGTYNKGEVNSAVIIRYIEKDNKDNLIYRSGGGITFMSNAEEEYREMIDKIYIPQEAPFKRESKKHKSIKI